MHIDQNVFIYAQVIAANRFINKIIEICINLKYRV